MAAMIEAIGVERIGRRHHDSLVGCRANVNVSSSNRLSAQHIAISISSLELYNCECAEEGCGGDHIAAVSCRDRAIENRIDMECGVVRGWHSIGDEATSG